MTFQRAISNLLSFLIVSVATAASKIDKLSALAESNRIVGGTPASPQDYLQFALFRYLDENENWINYCGGTVLTGDMIMGCSDLFPLIYWHSYFGVRFG